MRTGRANPDILAKIFVQYYGSAVPLKQVASVTVSESNSLLITAFDRSSTKEIEKAIQSSGLNLTPQVDGGVIRLRLPDLTEDRRKELVKLLKKEGEEAKVVVRNVRRDEIDTIKKQEKDKEISTDESKRLQDTVQKTTDKYIAMVEELMAKKEVEILKV